MKQISLMYNSKTLLKKSGHRDLPTVEMVEGDCSTRGRRRRTSMALVAINDF